ncbi:LysR substrate-binding domain-containing protein [Rhizobium sp. YIM 134829]|uniref:LysR substrate-binding domain-containing protein n=1 Tax=Rhizobium sp. YIM 134829 TaxID=3390453 RepID=UPI00397CA86D
MRDLNAVHLNGLKAVEAVARLGSLQAAAEELGVTIGAVSQQLARTEKQLGRPLFDRTPRGLQLTALGQRLTPRLKEGFLALNDAVAMARERDEQSLTISVAPVFAARWLVHRLDGFTANHPDLRLRIEATTKLIDLERSDVDLAIRVGSGGWPGVKAEPLLAQRVFPVCCPAVAARLAGPEDLLREGAVVDGQAMFDWSLWLAAAGLETRSMPTRHVFNEASLCLDAAIAGQGIMLAWQTLAVDALLRKSLVIPFPIFAETGFGHYLVTAPARRDSRVTTAFKLWLRREIHDSLSAARLPAEP